VHPEAVCISFDFLGVFHRQLAYMGFIITISTPTDQHLTILVAYPKCGKRRVEVNQDLVSTKSRCC